FFVTCLIYVTILLLTLSLHDALPILCYCCSVQRCECFFVCNCQRQSNYCSCSCRCNNRPGYCFVHKWYGWFSGRILYLPFGNCRDRKSTRLNSSHLGISYAVFCLKKK